MPCALHRSTSTESTAKILARAISTGKPGVGIKAWPNGRPFEIVKFVPTALAQRELIDDVVPPDAVGVVE